MTGNVIEHIDTYIQNQTNIVEGQRSKDEGQRSKDEGQKLHNLPYENDYVALVEWLAAEKQQGRDWYELNNRNRSAMCRQLTDVVGWVVDQNSLLRAQQREK